MSSAVSVEGRMLSGLRCSSETQDVPDAVTLYQTTMVLTVSPIIASLLIFLYWRFVALRFKVLACGAVLTLEKVREGSRKKSIEMKRQRTLERKRTNDEPPTTVSKRLKRKSIVGNVGQILRLTPFDAAVATITLLLYLIYPSITAATFSMMKCELSTATVRPTEAKSWVSNAIVLVYDRDEVCWQGRHLDYTLAVSIPVLILYIIGLPVTGLFVLFRRRQKLDTSPNTVFRFGLLYSGYASTRWWWEAVTTIRKMVVIACATFLSGDAMQLQILLGFVFGIIGLNTIGQPFENGTVVGRELALVEGASLGLLFVTVWSGMFFINFNQDEEVGGGGGSDTCKDNLSCDFLVFFVILLNILFLVLTLRRLFQYFEKRTKIIHKVAGAVKRRMSNRRMSKSIPRSKAGLVMVNNPVMLRLELATMSEAATSVSKGETSASSAVGEVNEEIQIHVENKSGRRYSYDSKNDVSTWLDTENGEIILDEKARVPQYLFGRVVNGMNIINSVTEETRWVEELAGEEKVHGE